MYQMYGGNDVQSPLLLLWAAVVVFALTNYLQRAEILRRLRRVEREVRAVRVQAGLPRPGAEHPEVLALVRAGQRMEAVRLYRQRTGAGLREAKEAVEDMGEEG